MMLVFRLLWLFLSPGRVVRGEAHRSAGSSPAGVPGVDGGHEPRGGGGDLRDPRRHGLQVSNDPRPSVPPHERLLNYRPERENRGWLNDMALVGALDAWSQDRSS